MAKQGQLDWDLIQLRAIKFVNRWKKSGKTNENCYKAPDCAVMWRAAIGGERNGRRRRCLPVCTVCQGR
ncbi:MAG: hypothetical protein LBH03_06215 [Holophagales bacterium]|nr:hypothetical protein [Holophagales bacterium]